MNSDYFGKRKYELVPYHCQDGDCLVIWEKTFDKKLGALSLDHRSVGEAIIDELNKLSDLLFKEQMTPQTISLDTHISDEDYERFEELFNKYCGG